MYYPILSRRGLKAKAKTAYARITLNRFTTAFFVFSFIYCFIQGIIQSLLFSIDVEFGSLASGIVRGGNIPFTNITYLEGTRGHLILRICDDVPHGQPHYPCTTIFNSTVNSPKHADGSENLIPVLSTRYLSGWEGGINVIPQPNPSDATLVNAVTIEPLNGPSLLLSEQCIQDLVYPTEILKNFKREDVTFISLQFWLVAISLLAIVNDSVPHVLAVLMTRTISTGWATYAIWRGPTFRGNFQELLADPGTPCSLDLFSEFFAKRQGYEIADLILSLTGLIFFSYLSLTLLKIYSAQSFKCVGAPEHVMRKHKFYMAVLACLQLECFVLPAGMGLWINVLTNTAIKKISAHTPIYQALYITTVIFLLPWIAMGWYSIRREMKRMMVAFLAIGFIMISGWSIMFYSIVFRWSFMQWPYLGCFTVASMALLIASLALGVVCRVNFGKGLAEYLHAESTLASLNFAPDAFAHKAENDTRSSIHKGSFDDSADYLNSAPRYFISTLPQTGDMDSRPTKEDRSFPVAF